MLVIFHLAHVSEAKLAALFYNMLKILYRWKILVYRNHKTIFKTVPLWYTITVTMFKIIFIFNYCLNQSVELLWQLDFDLTANYNSKL
jgi:hypothetical protein